MLPQAHKKVEQQHGTRTNKITGGNHTRAGQGIYFAWGDEPHTSYATFLAKFKVISGNPRICVILVGGEEGQQTNKKYCTNTYNSVEGVVDVSILAPVNDDSFSINSIPYQVEGYGGGAFEAYLDEVTFHLVDATSHYRLHNSM